MTFTAKQDGEYYNPYRIADGYSYLVDDLTKPITYTAYTAFGSSVINTNVQTATNGTAASWDFDLSGKTVDDFSDEYRGKLISVIKYSAASSPSTTTYKFYDSKHELELESFEEDSGSRTYAVQQIDINDIRKRVEQDSLTLAAAVQEKMGGTLDGDKVKIGSADLAGESGNNGTITLMEETLRHYDIDFSTLNVKMPDGLYGKGFRFYCATDNKEWFIKSVNINVSAVTNVDKLLEEIYNQATPLLTGDDKKYNHHMRFAVDSQNKILTIYDHRRFNVKNPPYAYQEQGAKIADGVSFKEDYAPERRNFSVKDLVIQHTDKAGMNLHIKIPQTTLDHIFDPLPVAPSTIFDYPVTSKESRDALLGSKDSSGILDRGLNISA